MAELTEQEQDEDERFEEDIATVDRLMAVLCDGLRAAGLYESSDGSEQARVRVDCYARSGLSLGMDSFR